MELEWLKRTGDFKSITDILGSNMLTLNELQKILNQTLGQQWKIGVLAIEWNEDWRDRCFLYSQEDFSAEKIGNNFMVT